MAGSDRIKNRSIRFGVNDARNDVTVKKAARNIDRLLDFDEIAGGSPAVDCAGTRLDRFVISDGNGFELTILLVFDGLILAEICRPDGEIVVLFGWCVG